MKNGDDQRGEKQHKLRPEQPPSITSPCRAQSGVLLTNAARYECREKTGGIRGLWQEGSTEGEKDFETESAREDKPWPMLSAWHEALKVLSLGCSLGMKQKPGFQPQFSISLVMWLGLDSKYPSAAVFCGQIMSGCSCLYVVRDCK